MAEFTAAVYQNEFLPDGGTDVNAIVTISCSGAGTAGQTGSGAAGEIIIVDTSGSMGTATLEGAKQAAQTALAEIVDGTWFAVIAGSDRAYLAYPRVTSGPGLVQMGARTRAEAATAIRAFVSGGGTAIGAWLNLAGVLFASVPEVTQRHAILLTDGENRERPGELAKAIRTATGVFQCDCRGAGTDWRVEEIRQIATALLGTVDIIPEPAQMQEQFRALMQASMARGVNDAQLRMWTPQGARGAVRPAGVPDGRGPHRPSYDGQPAHRRATRPGPGPTSPATTTSRSGCRPRRSVRSSSPRGCRSRSVTTSPRRAWSRRPGRTTPSSRPGSTSRSRTTPGRPSSRR